MQPDNKIGLYNKALKFVLVTSFVYIKSGGYICAKCHEMYNHRLFLEAVLMLSAFLLVTLQTMLDHIIQLHPMMKGQSTK
jgi:hypothetical protein